MDDIYSNKKENEQVNACAQCEKPAIIFYGGKVPLCVDCYLKLSQANYMEQQIAHNKMSWATSSLNFLEQQLYESTGGILSLKHKEIPQPPNPPNYFSNQIKVSESNIGVINSGTLLNIDTSISVMQNIGEKELADELKKFIQLVLDNNELNIELKKEIIEQMEYILTEITAKKNEQRKSMIKKIIDNITQSIVIISGLVTIWDKIIPLLKIHFGL